MICTNNKNSYIFISMVTETGSKQMRSQRNTTEGNLVRYITKILWHQTMKLKIRFTTRVSLVSFAWHLLLLQSYHRPTKNLSQIYRVFSKWFFHADLKNEVHFLLTPTVFLISFFRFFEILAKSTNFRKQIS